MYATEVHVHVVRINNYTIMYKLNEPHPSTTPIPTTGQSLQPHLQQEKDSCISSEASIFPLYYFKMKVMFETHAY